MTIVIVMEYNISRRVVFYICTKWIIGLL